MLQNPQCMARRKLTVDPNTPAAISPWWVYMLECQGQRLYTGIAVDVRARYAKHCNGDGAAFTRINPPLRVIAAMPCANRSAASMAECALKKLRRPAKLQWAAQWPWR